MIDFIFIMLLVIFLFLVLSMFTNEYVMGMITSMGMIVAGIYLALYGAGDVMNILTETLALIVIALGSYILIRGTMEKAQEVL